MNFDVRSYCERLAKADPERFRLNVSITCTWWHLADATNKADVYAGCYAYEAWAFIGPLADELGIKEIDLGPSLDLDTDMTQYAYDSLLEATFAAVVEKLEAAKP